MSDIAPISPLYGPSGGRIDPGALQGHAPDAAAGAGAVGRDAQRSMRADGSERALTRPSDRVDISDRARLLGKLAALPAIREDLVARIRDQIAAGEYDTDERIDAAIEELLAEMQ